jgi:hypothetical protein
MTTADTLPTAYAVGVTSCAGARENLESLAGIDSWYDGTADVVVIGRMGLIANTASCRKGEMGFEILCVESVAPVPGDFYGPWLFRRYF